MLGLIILLIVFFIFIGLLYINIHTKYKEEVQPTKVEKIIIPDQNVELDEIEEVMKEEE